MYGAGKDEDGSGAQIEIEECIEVMWEFHTTLNLIFVFYCACGADITCLFFNEYSKMVEDFDLASRKSKFCKRADLDRLFIAIDTKVRDLPVSPCDLPISPVYPSISQ